MEISPELLIQILMCQDGIHPRSRRDLNVNTAAYITLFGILPFVVMASSILETRTWMREGIISVLNEQKMSCECTDCLWVKTHAFDTIGSFEPVLEQLILEGITINCENIRTLTDTWLCSVPTPVNNIDKLCTTLAPSDASICTMCQEDIKKNSPIYVLPCSCNSMFHASEEVCPSGIKQWLYINNKCPVCRQEIVIT